MARDPDFCVEVPEDFDDTDDETGVYPIAAKLFVASTAAEVFRKAHEWVGEHDIRLVDVAWNCLCGEEQTYALSIYFAFELDPEEP
ncbi:hypothetical protein MMF93_20720 [Streptomyces tubbatahanensis]|uniref:Uncharacterized protein n=1 Tax=Streptomyces tubbatahanensis TaxID=2923272 RepID=A0ABY3XW42_9ACTN|nr:hypothetical protein [Streptomyces tubbatahanensis]UNS98612.1 hypothetical protein MMF93_20720 [Streptomyces tubbatahanensis]